MSLTLKRNFYLIPLAIVWLLILIYFWNKKIFSINFSDWLSANQSVTETYVDIENEIDLFDITQVHTIEILLSQAEYENMIDTFANTSEKDYYKTDIIIDWVTIEDVWVRLKWNSTLKSLIWWMKMWRWWNNQSSKTTITEEDYVSQIPLLIKFDKYKNQTYQWHQYLSIRIAWMWWNNNWTSENSNWNNENKLLKWTNENTNTEDNNENKKWFNMWWFWWFWWWNASLLSEPLWYQVYKEMWLPAPDSSYWVVIVNWTTKLFILSEIPEDSWYLNKYFTDNWVLYKAWNFVKFEYLWEDPTLYSEYFEQKTRVNDYDTKPLIELLKFISNSTDEEFAEQINDYIDVNSVLSVLAIDNYIWNNDSFWWMVSNFYLYYNLEEKKFYLLTWDQNLAFWWMWWWKNMWNFQDMVNNNSDWNWEFNFENMKPWNFDMNNMPNFDMNNFSKDFDENKMPWNFWWFWWKDWWKWWMMWSNLLKTRLLENETFKQQYDEITKKLEETITTEYVTNYLQTWIDAFNKYNEEHNLINQEDYNNWVEKLINYFNEESNWTESMSNNFDMNNIKQWTSSKRRQKSIN